MFALTMCAMAFGLSPVAAQESSVDITEPSRITDSLISRSELNRLLNQPVRDANPLRQTEPMAKPLPQPVPSQPPILNPIVDSQVQPTTWQSQEPQVEPPQSDQASDAVAEAVAADDPIAEFGPMPSPAMQSFHHKLDMLLEIPIEQLKDEIAARRATIKTSLGFDEDAKKDRLRHIEIAETAAAQATQNVAKKDELQNRVINLNKELESLRLESKKPAEPDPVDRSLEVAAMQSILGQLQAELAQSTTNVRKIQERIQQRDDRMARIPNERLQSRNEVTKLHEEFLQKQATGTEEIEVLLAIKARELAENTNAQLLDQEASWHDLSQELLPLSKTIHQREVQRLEHEINAWNKAIAGRKQAELEKQIQVARQAAVETHAALKDFSRQTTELAQARADLAEKIGKLQNDKLKVSKQQSEVHDQKDSLENSIREVGKDGSRDLLIQVHRNLIRPYEGMAKIRRMEARLRQTRGTILKLRAEQELVADAQAFIRDHLKIEHDVPVADTTLIAMAEEAVETHRQQLTELERDNTQFQKLLLEVLPERKLLLEEISATRELVDTHALWVQSADPMSLELLSKSSDGAKEFFEYTQWRELGQSIVGRVTNRPYECAVGLLGLMVAFVVGRKFKG